MFLYNFYVYYHGGIRKLILNFFCTALNSTAENQVYMYVGMFRYISKYYGFVNISAKIVRFN
jgi:hypothetical protein